MEDARRLEADLLCGVLDAFPYPAALIDRDGETVYVNSRECPVDLWEIHLHERADVRGVIESGEPSVSRLRLEDGAHAASGLLELNPINAGDETVGVLLTFHADKPPSSEPLRDMRQSRAAEQIHLLLETYGDSVEAKRRAADELGIGLSTLYRIMANEKKKEKKNRAGFEKS